MEQKRERTVRSSRRPTIETLGEVFLDGHHIELLSDPLNPNRLELLYSNGKISKVSPQVAHDGHIYCPAVLPAGMVQAIRLPSRLGKTIAISKLFAQISSQFRQKLDIPDDDADRLGFVPLASWFSDVLPVVPSLTICGEDASYGMDVLRLTACFCRRPLLLGSISGNGWSLVADARPTLLRFDDGMSAEKAELQPSSFRDLVSLDSRGVHNFCHMKIVFTASGSIERAVLDSGVLVSIGAENKKGVRLPDYELKRISDEFQPLLLAYRLSRWHDVQKSRFDVPDFTYPTRAIASSLGACVEGDRDLTARLTSLLRWQDDAVRAERCIRVEPCLVEVLLGLVHESLTTERPQSTSVAVQEITNSLNTTIRTRGAIQEYCSEEVGRVLKKLCIPKRRGAAGMKVVFGTETARRVHTLARSYGVSLVKPCPQCTECAKVRV